MRHDYQNRTNKFHVWDDAVSVVKKNHSTLNKYKY